MFSSVPAVFLYRDFVDFRKSINGLATIVEQQMERSPLSGSVFVFCNKGRDKLKVLYWDNTGFALWYSWININWHNLYAQKIIHQAHNV